MSNLNKTQHKKVISFNIPTNLAVIQQVNVTSRSEGNKEEFNNKNKKRFSHQINLPAILCDYETNISTVLNVSNIDVFNNETDNKHNDNSNNEVSIDNILNTIIYVKKPVVKSNTKKKKCLLLRNYKPIILAIIFSIVIFGGVLLFIK